MVRLATSLTWRWGVSTDANKTVKRSLWISRLSSKRERDDNNTQNGANEERRINKKKKKSMFLLLWIERQRNKYRTTTITREIEIESIKRNNNKNVKPVISSHQNNNKQANTIRSVSMSSKNDPLLCPAPPPDVPSALPPTPTTPTTAHHVQHRTYVAGEDAARLARAASSMGLEEHDRERKPLRPVREAVAMLWSDSTLNAAARMHSVGAIGQDEVVDNSGTLHLHYTLRRRRRRTTGAATTPTGGVGTPTKQSYGTLTDLFHREELEQQQPPTEGEGGEEEEEEEVIVEDVVEGGSLNAAIFGIVKGTVGPGKFVQFVVSIVDSIGCVI